MFVFFTNLCFMYITIFHESAVTSQGDTPRDVLAPRTPSTYAPAWDPGRDQVQTTYPSELAKSN
jgi:hypothetical protein